MKKNGVVISRKDGTQFEVKYNWVFKTVTITCIKVEGLNFHGAIDALIKNLELEVVDENGIMDIVYRCNNRNDFEKILSALETP